MAVTIVQSPPSVAPIGNSVWWKLNLDSFGISPERKKIAFQLFKTAGVLEMTDLRTVKPPGSTVPADFIVDATKAIRDYGLVKTSVPTLGLGATGTVENDAAIIQAIHLDYGEIIYSSEDCEPVINPLESSTSIKVINSALNLWDDKDFADGSHFPLNSYPKQFWLFEDTLAWIWVFNGGSCGVQHTAYYKDGTTEVLNGSANPAWQVALFALSNAALSDHFNPDLLIKIVSVFTFPVGPPFTFTTCYQKCPRPQVIQEFYALEPLGGYTTFVGERVESNVESDSSLVDLPLNIESPDHTISGINILEKDSRLQQTYISKLPNDEEYAKYLTAIASATKYLVRIKDESGTSKLANFNISSPVSVFKTDGIIEISITGTVGTTILNQL